ncbi:hypothetical protein DFP73DRAFT_544251 [Morchella snyderi]|nr:hypothetical protein DFP73DRAFT_544251 [Morchella snyderi]
MYSLLLHVLLTKTVFQLASLKLLITSHGLLSLLYSFFFFFSFFFLLNRHHPLSTSPFQPFTLIRIKIDPIRPAHQTPRHLVRRHQAAISHHKPPSHHLLSAIRDLIELESDLDQPLTQLLGPDLGALKSANDCNRMLFQCGSCGSGLIYGGKGLVLCEEGVLEVGGVELEGSDGGEECLQGEILGSYSRV